MLLVAMWTFLVCKFCIVQGTLMERNPQCLGLETALSPQVSPEVVSKDAELHVLVTSSVRIMKS